MRHEILKTETTFILIKNEMTSFLDNHSDSSMFIGATLKDRFFRSDLDKGFARVRSKVESVVSSRSLDLGDSDLVDGSLGKELSKLGTERNAQRLRPSASSA